MSAKISGRVWDLDLSPAQALVLQALADHADHEGRNIYPSMELLIWKTNMSESTVHRAIKDLKAMNLLIASSNEKGGRGRTVVYEIHIDNGKFKQPFVRRKMSDCNENQSTKLSQNDTLLEDEKTPEKGTSSDTLNNEERVSFETLKGVITDTKGCQIDTSLIQKNHPEPSENLNCTSTSTEELGKWGKQPEGKPDNIDAVKAYYFELAQDEVILRMFYPLSIEEMSVRYWQHWDERDWKVHGTPINNWRKLAFKWLCDTQNSLASASRPTSANIGTPDDLLAFVTGTGK